MTAEDLLAHCGADDDEDRFLNAELSDIQPHLDHISDRSLVETLKHGIGFYHEALSKQDKRIVERLFQSGAIQVLICVQGLSLSLSRRFSMVLTTQQDTAWSLPVVQLSCHNNGRSVIRGQGTPLC
jgi:pre-mRNA-splicing helicase BRR2